MAQPEPERTALVVGAGLVGTLCSAMLAARGWTVTLLEGRADPRVGSASARARSINLALSPRGIEALRSVSPELVERVLEQGIEMRGRMVHKNVSSRVDKMPQDYGLVQEGEVIRSISRTQLGIELLDHVDRLPSQGPGSVTTRFNTKLVDMDVRGAGSVQVTLSTHGDSTPSREQYDFVIGADGAYSKVRRELMRNSHARFDYRQFYARHSYLELSIPAGPDNSFSIEPNYLHIWPRGEFMLIALANLDKSFTLTLFAYETTFKSLDAALKELEQDDPNPVVELFRKEFPDAFELMGEQALLQSWRENPKDGLITVECSPYHYENKVLLIGDSAHAMVPFYGQGMNCGFEDVRVLSSILDHFEASPVPLTPSPLPYSSTAPRLSPQESSRTETTISERLSLALSSYTKIRARSLEAIQRLAHENYTEMASSVLSPLYLVRLSLDRLLSRVFTVPGLRGEARDKSQGGIRDRGATWESLYRMTTFRCGLAYEEVIRRRQWQGRVLERVVQVTSGLVVGALVAGLGWYTRIPSRYRLVRV
ncbi:kynurenine 3-monooxygenase [Sporobolomyces koalae]|uniref:kynurenine 3-monooxygenase n=1 Tax=Sporobolomyces koalae TaxID=500713 RepID=UPI0031763CD8